MKTLLSTAYLPPIEYFSLINKSDCVFIEQYEHYGKQTYRNRTCIMTGNGEQALSIPIKQTHQKILTKDVRIDYATHWQTNHWRAISSAYNNSPYFLYYQDYLRPFFEKKHTFLIDFNTEILQLLLNFLKINLTTALTTDYISKADDYFDARELINPKTKKNSNYPMRFSNPYRQVFEDRFGFTPNLSIIDLLFNEGNESLTYINNSAIHIL